jgi:hypothetical protein
LRPGSLRAMPAAAPTRRGGATPQPLRLLLIVGFVLGAVATAVVVVFADEPRWLRVAVLLAIWAALIAAFAMARFRREAQVVSARESEIARTYELELHREITARREFETALVGRVREELESVHSADLRSVREQLERLTSALSDLMDGDVLVERLTLSAESTRVRGMARSARSRLSGVNLAELTAQAPRPAPTDDDTIDAEVVEQAGSEKAGFEQAGSERAAGHVGGRPTTEPAGRHPGDLPDAGSADVREPPATAPPPAAASSTLQTDRRPDAPASSWARRHRQHAGPAGVRTSAPRIRGHELHPDDAAQPVDDARISVSQLLAAFGATVGSEPGPHRRRRAEE